MAYVYETHHHNPHNFPLKWAETEPLGDILQYFYK